MKRVKCVFIRLGLFAVPLLVLILAGCTSTQVMSLTAPVRPLSSGNVVALDADATVHLMRAAGFSDKEILDMGTDLRNSLARYGVAQIRIRDKTEAIFAVHNSYIHASTRRAGTFIYDIETGRVR